jgi:hypothetical protein
LFLQKYFDHFQNGCITFREGELKSRNEGLNEAHIKELDFVIIFLLSNPPATSSSCCGWKTGTSTQKCCFDERERERERLCTCVSVCV